MLVRTDPRVVEFRPLPINELVQPAPRAVNPSCLHTTSGSPWHSIPPSLFTQGQVVRFLSHLIGGISEGPQGDSLIPTVATYGPFYLLARDIS